MRKVFIIAIVLSFFAAQASAQPESPRTEPYSESELNKFQYCGSDDDCIALSNGCCDCAQGGQFVAINKERQPDFGGNFNCIDFVCPKPDRSLCMKGVVSCVEHKCRYFDGLDK